MSEVYGKVVRGSEAAVRDSYEKWRRQPVDMERLEDAGEPAYGDRQTTLRRPISVTGHGTYRGRAQRTLTLSPSAQPGWWFDRRDLMDSLPVLVSVRNVWTTVRNIVLLSGTPHNYMRMVEHIIALKVGMGLDNVLIRADSGDPPLFDRGSMDMVEAVERAGIVEQAESAAVFTVAETVTVGGPNGSFLTFLPAEKGSRALHVDCAIDFPNAIGRQRIRFTVTPAAFRYGAPARTNTNLWMMLYCKTIGKIFADVRNLGYSPRNILVAGPRKYWNEPKLMHRGRSLEAVWHRACLDLLAAVALIDRGRLAGRIISYKSGHTLDAQMISALYRNDLLVPV